VEVISMQAVFVTGGKQYRASVGESINVEKLPAQVGDRVELDKVLMVVAPDQVHIGRPVLEGAKVVATVTQQGLERKKTIFKYHPKERYRVKRGHRQPFTRLRIEDVVLR
jgi:large subunit ribosomal protein L21